MLKKKLPVDIDNFEKLRKEDFYYIYGSSELPSDEPLTFLYFMYFLKAPVFKYSPTTYSPKTQY